MSDKKRHIRFAPVSQAERNLQSKHKKSTMLRPLGKYGIHATIYIWICLLILAISNVVYLVGFVTDAWGVLVVEEPSSGRQSVTNVTKIFNQNAANNATHFNGNTDDISGNSYHGNKSVDTFQKVKESWEFGLWQSCRSDGFCIGPRFPAFYSVTRAFAVIGLFGHVLSFAWMLGHTLEQLVPFEPTTMMGLTSLIISTDVCVLIAVCCFGGRWQTEFEREYHGTRTYLSYSFYLVVVTVVLLTFAAALVIGDICLGYKEVKLHEFVTAEKILKSKGRKGRSNDNDGMDRSDSEAE